MSRNDCALHFEIVFTVLQAMLALLSGRIQVTQATDITVSPSSLVFPSSTSQINNTQMAETGSLTTRIITSSVLFTPSASSETKSSTFSRYAKTATPSGTISLPMTTISVTHSNITTTPSMPTTVVIVKGLPDGQVIAVVAAILGAVLLILFAVIVWYLCIVHTLERRPLPRVQPSEISRSVDELV